MSLTIPHRKFDLRSTGWSVDDFANIRVPRRWLDERFELVDGVLAKLPPQGFGPASAVSNLRRQVERHVDATSGDGMFYCGTDVLLGSNRIAHPDMVFLTDAQCSMQRRPATATKNARRNYNPIWVKPLLIVESLALGYEDHDRVTKRQWYEQAKIRNYWLLNSSEGSIICLRLVGGSYIEEAAGCVGDKIVSSAFPSLAINLAAMFKDE